MNSKHDARLARPAVHELVNPAPPSSPGKHHGKHHGKHRQAPTPPGSPTKASLKNAGAAGDFVHRDLLEHLPVMGDGVAARSFMISFSYRDDTTAEEMLEPYNPQEEIAAEKLQSSFRRVVRQARSFVKSP